MFRARIGGADHRRLAGVPVVHGGVEVQAGIGGSPGSIADFFQRSRAFASWSPSRWCGRSASSRRRFRQRAGSRPSARPSCYTGPPRGRLLRARGRGSFARRRDTAANPSSRRRICGCVQRRHRASLFREAGFTQIDPEGPDIVPDHFEPFERRNIRLRFAVNTNQPVILFKGDGDQDRPNQRPT